MTPIKRISREPTEEMAAAGQYAPTEDSRYDESIGIFQAMFDAAPDIESEAEKKAQGYLEYCKKWSIHTHAVEIIRALLAERGKI
jgi:hypothetical protein